MRVVRMMLRVALWNSISRTGTGVGLRLLRWPPRWFNRPWGSDEGGRGEWVGKKVRRG